MVRPDHTGFLSESGDLDGLANHLSRLVEDKALRQRIGKDGWSHVRDRYHYTRLVHDTDAMYRSLLN